MNEATVVVDASAVLALLQGEPFTKSDPELVVGAWISAVNLSEVLAKLHSAGLSEVEAVRATAALGLRVVTFTEGHAQIAASLSSTTRQAGLSFGDRACLATAMNLDARVLTADRAWASLDPRLRIELIR